jgi:sirohydrochlorin ferrochelatase
MTLDKQRWQQVETLYHAALEHEPSARDAFLAQACAGDEDLRREVEELLRYDGAAESFIEGNALVVRVSRVTHSRNIDGLLLTELIIRI